MPAKKKRTSHLPGTFEEAWDYFSDQDRCVEYIAALRWPDGPVCPECGGKEYSYLTSRRLWKCKDCKKQYSVRVGTIFEDSPLPLRKWLMAIWEIANDRNGISSHELARKLSIQQKSAWFVLHRVRLAMQTGSFEKYSDKMDGAIEVDETLIGSKARNLKLSKRRELAKEGKKLPSSHGKTAVIGFRQRDGQVRAEVQFWESKAISVVELNPVIARTARAIIREGLPKGWTGLRAHDAIHLATAKYVEAAEFHTGEGTKLARDGELCGFEVGAPKAVNPQLPTLGRSAKDT